MSKGYQHFLTQVGDAILAYPSLMKVLSGDRIILKGILKVIDEEGIYWDEYEVEIHATDHFPAQFPALYETGGKIPRIGDWHVNEDTFSCCTTVTPEEILRCQRGINLTVYIAEYVMPYLFNQTHRRIEGYYVNGEYAHGAWGLLQYYGELLGSESSPRLTVDLLRYIAQFEPPLRTCLCFCGSKRKYRHCHRNAYQLLKSLGSQVLLIHAYQIEQKCR
jgi:hypothetical protein